MGNGARAPSGREWEEEQVPLCPGRRRLVRPRLRLPVGLVVLNVEDDVGRPERREEVTLRRTLTLCVVLTQLTGCMITLSTRNAHPDTAVRFHRAVNAAGWCQNGTDHQSRRQETTSSTPAYDADQARQYGQKMVKRTSTDEVVVCSEKPQQLPVK